MVAQDPSHSVLVVRGEQGADAPVLAALRAHGFVPTVAAGRDEALRLQGASGPAIALVALGVLEQEADGSLVAAMKRAQPALSIVVLVNGEADLRRCCAAVLAGADAFLDVRQANLAEALIERIAQCAQVRLAAAPPAAAASPQEAFRIVGLSKPITRVLELARRAAAVSDAPVLISGETGTGKQLLAEAIHKMDPKRSRRPFIPVNCASITGALAESALFGHVKGAFTGADGHRLGYFRAANGGTLLLDEISELDPALQPKLLRALQEGRILPVGADHEVEIDVRVIAATNRPLAAEVEAGRFRMDLYQRLNVIELHLPPLRQRAEDIPLLLRHFLKKYSSYAACEITEIDPRVIEALQRAELPGNVRALENLVRRMLAFKTGGHRLELADLPESLLRQVSGAAAEPDVPAVLSEAFARRLAAGRMHLTDMLAAAERQILGAVLHETDAPSQSALARRLGITRRTLYNKLKQHQLNAK